MYYLLLIRYMNSVSAYCHDSIFMVICLIIIFFYVANVRLFPETQAKYFYFYCFVDFY